MLIAENQDYTIELVSWDRHVKKLIVQALLVTCIEENIFFGAFCITN